MSPAVSPWPRTFPAWEGGCLIRSCGSSAWCVRFQWVWDGAARSNRARLPACGGQALKLTRLRRAANRGVRRPRAQCSPRSALSTEFNCDTHSPRTHPLRMVSLTGDSGDDILRPRKYLFASPGCALFAERCTSWSKGRDWKSRRGSKAPSWVRIPLSPPCQSGWRGRGCCGVRSAVSTHWQALRRHYQQPEPALA